MCNLYSHTRAVDAMRQVFAPDALEVGATNLAPQPAIYPDQRAPVITRGHGKLHLQTARWGLPTPASYLVGKRTDRGVTNLRNAGSAHWRPWLGPEHRCLVPFERFAEPAAGGGAVWFELADGQPGFFAGILVRGWTSVRKLADGATCDDLFGFLTTEPNSVVARHHPKAMPVILTTPLEWTDWLTAPWPRAAALQRPLADHLLHAASPGC